MDLWKDRGRSFKVSRILKNDPVNRALLSSEQAQLRNHSYECTEVFRVDINYMMYVSKQVGFERTTDSSIFEPLLNVKAERFDFLTLAEIKYFLTAVF